MHSHMSYLVDNTGVSNLLEHVVSTTYLYEIHLCKLILSSSHRILCSMEDNPYLVDMCWVVILISYLTSRHISFPYIQAHSMMYSSNYPLSNHLISILIWSYFVSFVLSLELLDLDIILPQRKFLHDIRAIPNSYKTHVRKLIEKLKTHEQNLST